MSLSGLDLLLWRYYEGGYDWQDAPIIVDGREPVETRVLTVKPIDKARYVGYKPLEEFPTLFREFATQTESEDSFAAFANKYGELGIGVLVARPGPLTLAEPYYEWVNEHRRMRRVVDVLVAIRANDAATLGQWFVVTNDSVRYERADDVHMAAGMVAVAGSYRTYLWDWASAAGTHEDALIRFATGWAQYEINKAIADSDSKRQTLTHARVLFDVDRGRMMLRVVPDNLLGAMWLQCARALTDNPVFKECEHCGKWFELSPDNRRKQSKYCSDRCKVAAYRVRKANAADRR